MRSIDFVDHALRGYRIILKATVSKMIEMAHEWVKEWKVCISRKRNFVKGAEIKANHP